MTALNEEDEQQTLESMLGGTCNKKLSVIQED